MWSVSNSLIVCHAIAGGVLAGSAIHNAVLAVGSLRGRPVANRLRKLYPQVILVAWLVVMALGLLVYPSFRLDVRADFLDASAPWAVWLFEVKEHGVALGLLLLVYLIPVSRDLKSRCETAVDRRFYDVASIALAVVVSWATVVGLIVSSLRPQ